ncbi:MAG: 1,4-alpha-glucan branching protein GlgB [Lachnospiraceae bacterium]|nr:1,4-alpha-glucan branching protein GlgB [Lachnospiraceae bacterium]MDY4970701.1 1,4-alpha-glucan branching protein GlgB [Lachnospiraceae bacterium]
MKATGFLSEMDRYLFGHGTHYEIYKKLGSHSVKIGKKTGIYFAVWAPDAKAVSLVGNFNNWDTSKHRMTPIPECGIFEIFTNDIEIGEIYKYAIRTADDRIIYKADPYANSSECRPGTASVVTDLSSIKWNDKKWLEKRGKKNSLEIPVAIYEVHPGSWKKHRDEHGSWYFTYRELASELTEYVKEMGYTHVELMGIPEHPLDASWGYQVTGYYAPTSRYGTPEDFAYMVNYLHNNGIGVILNWVPGHFPKDAHGLAEFDGKPVYEYADPAKAENSKWGTKVFDFGRNQVCNFLIANALFWVEQFHIDGLHMDSGSALAGDNQQAAEFFKHLNSMMHKRNPGVIMITGDSETNSNATDTVQNGGLGFDLKWNTKWMNDFLEYMKYDPYFRQFNHNSMISCVKDAEQNQIILPVSHDDVVHQKGSMYQKMPGDKKSRIANLKVAYTYLMGQPGKKLLFMGQDFAQDSEWDEERQLDWYLQYDPQHRQLQQLLHDLLLIYKKYSCLHADNRPYSGFEWINSTDNKRSIFSFIRTAPKSGTNLLFVLNFTPVSYPEYAVGVPKKCKYTLILDETRGLISKPDTTDIITPVKEICDGQSYRLSYSLPAYGIAVFKY